jgi:hypothetical protein
MIVNIHDSSLPLADIDFYVLSLDMTPFTYKPVFGALAHIPVIDML